MPRNAQLSRRRFIQSSAAMATVSPWLINATSAAEASDGYLTGRLYKTLKIGMVQVEGTLTDKFRAAKAAGFHGIELGFPGNSVEEAKQAIAETGLPVDGSVCAGHWQVRHTDPSAEVRAKALDTFKQALRDTKAVGGNTVLLVAGRGDDGTEEETNARAIENISQAIPLAAELGVYIAIENVWNRFHYDHEGQANQTAEKYIEFVDAFNSPWVGMQFDIGNHWKYGSMGDWIRALGTRIVKLDLKGFSREQDKFTKIGEGDLDWSDVRKSIARDSIHRMGSCRSERWRARATQRDFRKYGQSFWFEGLGIFNTFAPQQ